MENNGSKMLLHGQDTWLEEAFLLMAQIDFFEKTLGLRLSTKDFRNLIFQDPLLQLVFCPYMTHNHCAYCCQVKEICDRVEKKYCYARFLEGPLSRCQQSDSPYIGLCHAGVYEFILPVWCDGELIFVLTMGSFRHRSHSVAESICQRFGHRFRLEEAATARLLESYSCLPPLPELPPEQLVSGMCFIVKAICNAWKRIRNTSNVAQLPPLPILSESTGNATINRAIDFMLSYYTERLTVADIAAAAGCSSSYITHRFQKYTGMSIVRYLNLLRVRRAVLSMANKDISLTEIALQCGFSSAAYFSRVFTELMGKSPIEVQQML